MLDSTFFGESGRWAHVFMMICVNLAQLQASSWKGLSTYRRPLFYVEVIVSWHLKESLWFHLFTISHTNSIHEIAHNFECMFGEIIDTPFVSCWDSTPILDKMLLFKLAISSGMSFSDLCSASSIHSIVSSQKEPHIFWEYSEITFPCRKYL